MASFTWVQRVVVIVRTGLRGYGTWYGKAPVVMAFATCFTKGLLSDTIAQTMLIEDYNKQAEAEEEGGDGNAVGAPSSSSQPQRTWDWMRYAAMSLYSGLYCGIFQHFLYNVWYTRWFGSSAAVTGLALLRTAGTKLLFEQLIHVPLFCFPVYYMFINMLEGGTAMGGLRQYGREYKETVAILWLFWTPIQAANFSIVPPQFRVALVGFFSIVWLVILSHISHREREAERQRQYAHLNAAAHVVLEDVSTHAK